MPWLIYLLTYLVSYLLTYYVGFRVAADLVRCINRIEESLRTVISHGILQTNTTLQWVMRARVVDLLVYDWLLSAMCLCPFVNRSVNFDKRSANKSYYVYLRCNHCISVPRAVSLPQRGHITQARWRKFWESGMFSCFYRNGVIMFSVASCMSVCMTL